MGFICNTFGHKWNGCKCARCGEVRNEQHSWRGCICTLCGKVRDEQHNWNLCLGRCLRCGKMRPPQHLWKGAACIRCGIKRDLKEITDPSVLADIAKNDESEWIRKDAVSRVKDQSILADIAKHDRSERVRKAAVVCVEDQRVLKSSPNLCVKFFRQCYVAGDALHPLGYMDALREETVKGAQHLGEVPLTVSKRSAIRR